MYTANPVQAQSYMYTNNQGVHTEMYKCPNHKTKNQLSPLSNRDRALHNTLPNPQL